MDKLNTAIQLFSLRDEMQADFYGTLEKVKEMGYDGVEFAGVIDPDGDKLRDFCKKIDLKPISAHVWYGLMDDIKTFEYYKNIGCEYVVVPALSPEHRPGGEPGFQYFLDNVVNYGKKANEVGLKLGYHNHDFEFAKIEDKYALDVLYDTISPDYLQTELDTCWVNVGGENPVDYINKYNDRAGIVHLKDFVRVPAGWIEFRPVGYGLQDFYSIINACKNANTQWVVVEQDMPSMNKSPLECAKLSIDYLKTLL